MIHYKTPEEIHIMKVGGKILADVLFQVMDAIQPGVSEIEIDALAERLIRERGGEPGFQRVQGYKHTVCMSTNDVVVHGIPGRYHFKAGDVVGVDCGVFYQGFHTDMSESVIVPGGAASKDAEKFLHTGKKALDEAIKVAVIGNRIGHISKTIQEIVEGNGYSIVRSLIGHGVGRDLHEAPEVPGYLARSLEKTPPLKENMTIAVEVIYTMGGREVVLDPDGWTIRTKDGKLAGLYERTIAITKNGPLMLTS